MLSTLVEYASKGNNLSEIRRKLMCKYFSVLIEIFSDDGYALIMLKNKKFLCHLYSHDTLYERQKTFVDI